MRWPSKREWALLAFVPALVLIGARAEKEGDDRSANIVQARPAGKATRGGRAAASTVALDLGSLNRDKHAVRPGNPFSSKTWYVAPPPPPPPPPPVKVAPAPPTAPRLPFTYVGRYADSGKPVFFLMKGNRLLTVSQGDVIDGTYRVEGVVGSLLGLTYLPLNIRQNLDTGDAG